MNRTKKNQRDVQIRNQTRALETIRQVLVDAEQNPFVAQVMCVIAKGIADVDLDMDEAQHAQRLADIVDAGMQTMLNIVATFDEYVGGEEE